MTAGAGRALRRSAEDSFSERCTIRLRDRNGGTDGGVSIVHTMYVALAEAPPTLAHTCLDPLCHMYVHRLYMMYSIACFAMMWMRK
jgi:hypothetical protein